MTDEQLLETIATTVMGWEVTVDPDAAETYPRLWKSIMRHRPIYWFVPDEGWSVCSVEDTRTWNPLTSDNDCMEAIDEALRCGLIPYFVWADLCIRILQQCLYGADRRRAMIEHMATTVTK